MKSTRLWLGCLAMAGSCLVAPGCGGGGVPDPTSDSSAAPEAATPVVDRAGAVASAPEPTPAEAPKPEAAAPAPAAPGEAPKAESAPAPAPAAAPGEAPKPEAPKAEAEASASSPAQAPAPTEEAKPAATPTADSAGTDEMMRIATNSSPTPPADVPPAAAPAGPAPAGGPAPAPGGPPMPGAPMGVGPVAAGPAPAGGPIPGAGPMPAAEPGGREPGGRGPGAMAAGPGGMASEGGPGPMPGPGGSGSMSGGSGGAASKPIGPDTFRNPLNATQAFLDALKDKNKDRLAEVTARRSVTEAVEKHRKVFAAILEGSISDEELDDLAKALDGFRVMGPLPAKSTGMIGVLIGKMDQRDRLQRTVSVRKEKEGWKVMDIGGTIDFKPIGTMRPTMGRGSKK